MERRTPNEWTRVVWFAHAIRVAAQGGSHTDFGPSVRRFATAQTIFGPGFVASKTLGRGLPTAGRAFVVDGSTTFPLYLRNSLVVATGDLTVDSYIMDSVVIVGGKVHVQNGYIKHSTIIAGAAVDGRSSYIADSLVIAPYSDSASHRNSVVTLGQEYTKLLTALEAVTEPADPRAPRCASGSCSLSFDNGVVSIPNSPEQQAISDQLTMEAWVKPRAMDRVMDIVRLYPWFTLSIGDGVSFSTYSGGFGGAVTLRSPTGFPEDSDRWFHIACVYDGQTKSIYMDGVRVASTAHHGKRESGGVSFQIGDDDFVGLIDEVRVWNRARTSTEIARDMKRKLAGNQPGLIAAYSFDQGDGAIVKDRTQYGNDGWLGLAPGEDADDPEWSTDTPF